MFVIPIALLTRTVPSLLNARLEMMLLWWESSASRCPYAMSHTSTRRSLDPEAINLPSGEKEMTRTVDL